MLDKELIKKNFKKSINTYPDNAVVQKQTAKRLLSLIDKKNFNSILEIGSYSGILTKIINDNITYKSYLAIDIIDDSKQFLEKINPEIDFLNIDIENFSTDKKFDLIIANASLQWCDDFKSVILKLKSMLNKNGLMAISIFNQNNLIEIKNTFNLGLNYLSIEELTPLFSKNAKIINDEVTLHFNTPKDILRHLKLTGVNSIQKNKFSIKEIKEKLNILEKKYSNNLTYEPIYIIDFID